MNSRQFVSYKHFRSSGEFSPVLFPPAHDAEFDTLSTVHHADGVKAIDVSAQRNLRKPNASAATAAGEVTG